MPQVHRLGILLNPSNEAASLQLRDTEVAAHALGLELHVAHAATASDLGTAVEKLVAERASALVVLADPLFAAERARLAELALAHRLPSAFSPERTRRLARCFPTDQTWGRSSAAPQATPPKSCVERHQPTFRSSSRRIWSW